MSIVEILLEKGMISSDHLAEAVVLRKKEGMRLDQALVELGHLSEEQLLKVMSEQLGMEMIDLGETEIDVETLHALPPKLVYRKKLVPVARHDGALTVATSDPFDLYAFDEI